MDSNVDESLIEATIRRVAEAQAAREGSSVVADPAPAEDPVPPPTPTGAIAAVAGFGEPPDARADAEAGAPVDAEPVAGPSAADESAIEATIRRVAAAKAEREQASTTAASAPAEAAPGSVATRELDPPLSFAQRGHRAAALAFEPAPEAEPEGAALARIEEGLSSVHVLLQQIIDRLDRAGSLAGTAPPSPVSTAFSSLQDDAWEDEAPPVQTMPFSAPQRPSILRDPPARAPEQPLEADDADTRPLPAPLPPLQPDTRRGFDLLPRTYRITVEDKRRGVDLVPLHRALLAMDGVRDMSLLSYNNGVAIVSLETVSDIDTDVLGRAVSRAMSRAATVETHNERTLVVKLAED